ncbi:MAG: SMC-Scp complex subunit ScpB [Tissierellia bacterium]|nr:SMC-Scp complex subunit ScpB [Tissierellia bacterium]
MEKKKVKSIIESILYVWSDAILLKDLCQIFDVSKTDMKVIMDEMIGDYENEERGIRLVEIDGSYQFSTKPENYDYITDFVKERKEKSLTKPSLETLSIIAYKQPVTKLEIEELRGVKCDSTLKGLMELGLIEISGTLDRIGHPNLYSTTEEFLRKFGIKNLKELPQLEELVREDS